MNQTYTKGEISNRIIIFAVITVIFSLIACSIHVYDVRDTYLEQHQDAYFKQATVVKDSLQGQFEKIDVNVENMTKEIAENHEFFTVQEINDLINTYQDVTSYEFIMYEDVSGYKIYSGRTPNFLSLEHEIAITDNEEVINGIVINDEDVISTLFLIENEVWQKNIYRGDLSCYFDSSDIFEDSTFEYLTADGFCYITDFQNITLSMSEHSQENMGSKLIFQDIFQNTFGQSEETAEFYHHLYGEIDKNHNGAKYITAENGSEYLLTYQVLDNNSDTYMITYFNVDSVLAEVDDVVFRTALTCIFLILLTLILVMFVWLNSMKTTSLVEKMAYEDPITNGKNLNYFKVKSHEILKTYRAFSYLVERYDIANFRYINEAYGHKRADQLLKGCLELADEVFLESELCARMDSDQFVLLSVNDSSSAVRWASYRQSVNEYARTIGIKYPIRFKVGIYQLRDSDPDMDTVIDRANAARKLISSHSKEMTKTYSDSIVKDMRRMDQIESDMMRALNDGEFKVYLQQKQDIEKNEVCGAEALIRWVKPDGTIVSPVDFIPLFEKNGFVEQLDYYVLETVCSRQRELIDKNKIPVPISVNQSKVLLNNSDYVRNVERIFNRYKLPRNLVVLEVTESVFLNDEESIENIVKELKELGISTAMDDFGKGYSSLTLLKNVSFDILKIDRGFVSDSLTSAKSRWILSRIIELAYGLGMDIVCEGIETKGELENVRRLKCRVIQGFYFGEPIPMEEFIEKYIKEKVV